MSSLLKLFIIDLYRFCFFHFLYISVDALNSQVTCYLIKSADAEYYSLFSNVSDPLGLSSGLIDIPKNTQ